MNLVFPHIADWRLGKLFASLRYDAMQCRLQQRQHRAVHRLPGISCRQVKASSGPLFFGTCSTCPLKSIE